MKKCILSAIILNCFYFVAYCQSPESMGAIRQKISVKQYAGKNFTLQAASKVKQLENFTGAALFIKTQK